MYGTRRRIRELRREEGLECTPGQFREALVGGLWCTASGSPWESHCRQRGAPKESTFDSAAGPPPDQRTHRGSWPAETSQDLRVVQPTLKEAAGSRHAHPD